MQKNNNQVCLLWCSLLFVLMKYKAVHNKFRMGSTRIRYRIERSAYIAYIYKMKEMC